MDSVNSKMIFKLFFTCIISISELGFTEANTTAIVSTGQSQLDILAAQTANLAAKLNEEIAKREALEKEVQSKNDLTEFLRRDVESLNKTLEQEITKRQQVETTLSNVQTIVKNVKSTLDEDRGNVVKLSRDLRVLDSRFTGDVASLNTSLEKLQTTVDNIIDEVTNISTAVSGLDVQLQNQSNNIDQLTQSTRRQNETLQKELTGISSKMVQLEKKTASQNQTISSNTASVNKLNMELINQNSNLLGNLTDLNRELSMLNTSTTAFIKQTTSQNAAINTSINAVRAELAKFQSTDGTDIHDIKLNVTDLSRKIEQFAVLTAEYNKTIGNLSTKISTTSQSGDSEVYFFASKPRSLLRSSRPPVFTDVISSPGSTFDPNTSIFTIPLTGVYMFTVTLQKDETETDPRVMCWLKKNGQLLISIDAHSAFVGSAPSASNTIVLGLTKGDRVQLTQCTGSVFVSAEGSSFSGVLIH